MIGKPTKYNIALRPCIKEGQCFFENLSQQIHQMQHNAYLLSSDSHAHVTLCQLEAEDIETTELIELCQKISPLEISLKTDILFESVKEGGAACNIFALVQQTEVLKSLHEAIVSELRQKDRIRILGKVQEDYLPHVTLARVSYPIKFSAAKISETLIKKAPMSYQMILGEVGMYGQMPKILWSSP